MCKDDILFLAVVEEGNADKKLISVTNSGSKLVLQERQDGHMKLMLMMSDTD